MSYPGHSDSYRVVREVAISIIWTGLGFAAAAVLILIYPHVHW